MRVCLIAAMSRNRVIGKDGDLPWRLPADLKAFKAATLGKPVIMGRRTWLSIGRPLPGRLNIVISRNPAFVADTVTVCRSLDEALDVARASGTDQAMIIGGASLYAQALPIAHEMILTLVEAEIDGDTLFPEFAASDWQEVERRYRPADDTNPYAMNFVRLVAARNDGQIR